MTGFIDLEADQGANFSFELTFTDDQTNNAINIATYEFWGALKRAPSSTNVAANLICTIVSPSLGIMNIVLTEAQTANLIDRYFFQMSAKSDNFTDRVLDGTINFSPKV